MFKNFGEAIGSLIGWVIGAPIVFAMTFPYRPLNRKLIAVFRLESMSVTWTNLKWLYATIMFACWLFFVSGLFILIMTITAPWDYFSLAWLIGAILLTIGTSLLYNLLNLIWQLSSDPSTQMKLAGLKAEKHVHKLLKAYVNQNADSQLLNGTLLVFNKNTANEFSAELDHILITKKHIFVVETKYKSGTIQALSESVEWKVSYGNTEGQMRNALLQVKKSITHIRKELNFGETVEVIPIVAIFGKDVNVVDAPSNVVECSELVSTIEAFSTHRRTSNLLEPDSIKQKFLEKQCTDKQSFQRHIARADAAKDRHLADQIVQRASID